MVVRSRAGVMVLPLARFAAAGTIMHMIVINN